VKLTKIKFIILTVVFLLIILDIANSKEIRLKHNYLIKKSELKNYNNVELVILRASIYANYGYIFNQKWLHEYFTDKKWYKPNTKFNYKNLEKNDFRSSEIIKAEYFNRKFGGVVDSKKFKTKYFLKINITKEIPNKFIILIKNEKKKNNFVFTPKFHKASPLMDAKFLGPKNSNPYNGYCVTKNDNKHCEFYEVKFYNNNSIRSIQKFNNKGPSISSYPKYIYLKNGNLDRIVMNYDGTIEFVNVYVEYYKGNIVFFEFIYADNNTLTENKFNTFYKKLKNVKIYENK